MKTTSKMKTSLHNLSCACLSLIAALGAIVNQLECHLNFGHRSLFSCISRKVFYMINLELPNITLNCQLGLSLAVLHQKQKVVGGVSA